MLVYSARHFVFSCSLNNCKIEFTSQVTIKKEPVQRVDSLANDTLLPYMALNDSLGESNVTIVVTFD